MLLDVSILRLLDKDDFRVLRAIELGMRNHEIVPVPLIISISKQRGTVTTHSIKELLKHKLIHHENIQYDGYRLTTSGYDFLAIHTLVSRGQIQSFGRKIGTGKESDIYEVTNEEGEVMVMKLHRLGRISFRAVKSKRDYLRHRNNFNWLYLSRLAALGEFAFMKALWERGFPVPQPVDQNRHVVLMSLVDGYQLSQVKKMAHPQRVFRQIMDWLCKFAEVGLIHCDFNEFNLMINDEEELTIIDFPQMVSVWHENAEELFIRDRDCIVNFFGRTLHYHPEDDPEMDSVFPDFKELLNKASGRQNAENSQLDAELHASGFNRSDRKLLEKHVQGAEIEESTSNPDSEGSCLEEKEEEDEAEVSSLDKDMHKDGFNSTKAKEKEIVQKVSIEQKKLIQRAVRGKLKRKTRKNNTGRSKHTNLKDWL